PEVWSGLGDGDRLQLLRYVGERNLAAQLRRAAATLDAVLVATRPPSWKPPAQALAPKWEATQPPHLAAESRPTLKEMPSAVVEAWSEWCGVRTFSDVLACVLAGAAGARP